MKNIKAILLTVIIGVFFASCESKTYDEIATVTDPKYSPNVKAVMTSRCIGCHSAGAATQQEPYLENYEQVKDAAENGSLLCLIDNPTDCFYEASSIMPPEGRMPQATIDMIKLWATNGFPE
jgi:hypothetical protein